MKAFIPATQLRIIPTVVLIGLTNGDMSRPPKKSVAKTMLVKGPAHAILPIILRSEVPLIITAPGAIILKKVRGMALINVRIAPIGMSLNSAHNP